MSEISNFVVEQYDKLVGEESLPISEDSVKDAIRYIDDFDLRDSKSLFTIVAALNLLNAAVKKDNLKSSLYYAYIKTNVSKVADYYLSNTDIFEGATVYYEQPRKCFYFSIFDVVFSFHQVKETNLIVNVAANSEPIAWPGIRLQRIAQFIFEYGKQMNERVFNSEVMKSEINLIKKDNKSLIPCPECGRMLSPSAKFCPNCGFDLSKDNEIAQDVLEGEQIQIEVNGLLKIGIVQKKGKNFLDLKLLDNSIYRVKYNAISSILLMPPEIVDISTISAQVSDMLQKVLLLEDISTDSLIITNSTIQDCTTARVSVITDGGKTILCFMPPIGFSKKRTKNGDRIFCVGNLEVEICYLSISEMTYRELIEKLTRLVAKLSINPKQTQHINTILSYFRQIVHKSESREIIRQIKKKIQNIVEVNSEEKTDSSNKDNAGTANDSPTSTGWKPERPNHRLSVVENAKVKNVLIEKLPLMSEQECRQVEKELDTLIREGKREECLSQSYEVIATKKPTPKYLRSYLDRIVNTEIALDHIEQAKDILAVLIAFSETQKDTKPNNLSHLYISIARLFARTGNKDDASLALDWAEYIFPKNKKIVSSLRQSTGIKKPEPHIDSTQNSTQLEQSIGLDVVVSRMLIQDVEQYAKTQATLEGEEGSSPIELFNMAEVASPDTTKSFEFRAQMFLDAAAAYYNANDSSKTEFKLAVAHYARMKGNSLVAKISESVQQYPDSQSHLIAECDSARSYYLEALGLYNDLAQKRYLQELLLKYLKIESLASQVEGGRTPDTDWHKGTLKAKMRECLNDENIEGQKVLYRACIAIGTSSERAWNTLVDDADGINPLYSKLGEKISFRNKAYELINLMAKSSVDFSYAPGRFMKKIFENRQERIKSLRLCLEDCLKWDFSPFDISSFEAKWKLIDEYNELMTTTDKMALGSINEVINILKPYAGRKDNERYRNLVSSQQILIKSQRMVAETTTYYGRILFFHLQEKWLKEISRQIDEKDASSLPQLRISPEPCYINLNDEGQGVIDFVVTNDGDSTAQSFVVYATINDKEYTISHDDELPAGDSCVERFVSMDFSKIESADVLFKLIAKYKGKDLPTTENEATYEVESDDILTDEIHIPWKISNTPEENIFKGREEKLTTLINHYLSKDRTFTYILYGLTRTGKSSILDYLCDRIEGKSLHEDPSQKVMPFKWNFLKITKDSTNADLWMYLLEINIYNKLPDCIKDIIDSKYADNQLPETLRQSDLDLFIDALNSENIIPLITIDEFSNIRQMLKNGLVDATFLSNLRELALKGKACFVYAGTYDIKELPKEKDFGIEGQMTNTQPMHINEIEQTYADELIDACESIIFDDKAKSYIRALSGCVPYWIQWICLDCGKYAVAHKKRHLGYGDVDYVVRVLTGEGQPSKRDTWEAIDETNFHNNQISPNNVAEHQLISCISYLIRESTHIERGVSMDELSRLWDKYNVSSEKRLNMTKALRGLVEKKVIRQFTDETREVYRLNVDLFRRWWYVHHRDLSLEFSL